MDVHSWGKEHQRVIRRTSTQILRLSAQHFKNMQRSPAQRKRTRGPCKLTSRVSLPRGSIYATSTETSLQTLTRDGPCGTFFRNGRICGIYVYVYIYIYIYLFISVCVLCMYGPSGFWSPHSKPHPDPQKQVK